MPGFEPTMRMWRFGAKASGNGGSWLCDDWSQALKELAGIEAFRLEFNALEEPARPLDGLAEDEDHFFELVLATMDAGELSLLEIVVDASFRLLLHSRLLRRTSSFGPSVSWESEDGESYLRPFRRRAKSGDA